MCGIIPSFHCPSNRVLISFNAIIFSSIYPIKKLIAFSPQFSIYPGISNDESFLLVNETAASRVLRYWLTGPNAGQSDVFTYINQNSWLPDNITCNDQSLFWVATIYGPVLGLDENGQIIYQLNFNSNLLNENTGCFIA